MGLAFVGLQIGVTPNLGTFASEFLTRVEQ